jgi:hypothetical protein
LGKIVRRTLAASLVALTAAAAAAQQVPAPPANPEFRPTTMRLPEFDSGERVVVYGMVPIPDVGEGAPLFTAEDLGKMESETRRQALKTFSDRRKCSTRAIPEPFRHSEGPSLVNLLALEYERINRVAAVAGKAQSVTERAEKARRDAATGLVGMDVVIELELERQAAVNVLQKARAELFEVQAMIGDVQDMSLGQKGKGGITWAHLDMLALKRKKAAVGLGIAVPQDFKTLDIRNVVASQHKDKKGKDMVVVRGDIVNSGTKSVTLPSLSVSLVDERGWVLTNSTVSAPGVRRSLGRGKTQAFSVEMRPAPDLLKTAVVTFAAKHAAEPRLGVGVFCGDALAALN